MALPAIPVGLAAIISRILARGAQTGARGGANARLMEPSVGQAAAQAPSRLNQFGRDIGTIAGGGSLAVGVPASIVATMSDAPLGSRSTMEGFMPPEPLPPARERRYQFDETNEAAPFMRFLTSPSYEEPGFSGEQGKILEDAVKRGRGPSRVPLPPVRQPEPGPSVSSLWDRYNETGNPADFVRADRAMREAGITGTGEPMQRKDGGSVGGSDAALNQALEIIHRLLAERR